MGNDANAQGIFNFAKPAAWQPINGLTNAVVDLGLASAYAAYAYLDRFYIELNISEKDDAALTSIELFMNDILDRIGKGCPAPDAGLAPDAGSARDAGPGTVSSPLLNMLPADNEVGTWKHDGDPELITDQTELFNIVDGGGYKYTDRGWVSGVYANYIQGSRTITVMISDMGTAANAQAIYNAYLPSARFALPGRDNAAVDTGVIDAYAAYAYLDRFYIEIDIAEKSDAARYWIELFMSDILNRNSKGGSDAGNVTCTCDQWSSPCPDGESSCVICSGFSSLCSQCPVPTTSQPACNMLGLHCAYDQTWCDCVAGDAGSPIWSCVFLIH
jgi:hypothetical protein